MYYKKIVYKYTVLICCILLSEQIKYGSCDQQQQQQQENNNLIKFFKENDIEKSNQPKILTKYVKITSYEHHTVVLPCEVINLPSDMHIIWQYGKRGQDKPQIVLTIGRTQIENNYRVRVITNSSNDDDTGISFNYYKSSYYSSSSKPLSIDDLATSRNDNFKITSNNLEIRKLQLGDGGWYECQLPTKPTQINYVYLEVLGAPKIEANNKHLKVGDVIELTCQVKNLPNGYELQWSLNDKKIHANIVNKTNQHEARIIKPDRRNHKNSNKINDTQRSRRNSARNNNNINSSNSPFVIINDKINNFTISKLRILSLNEQTHKGLYKCKYDKLEAKYHLDVKSKDSNSQKSKQFEKTDKDVDYPNNMTNKGSILTINQQQTVLLVFIIFIQSTIRL